MLSFLTLLLGLGLLVGGAELLVRGAAALARGIGVSSLVVGLTVVAFGTSAPELAVSIGSVLSGKVDIAVGNVVGSNIVNVLLVLGLAALIMPLVVDRQLIRQEVPIMIGASLLVVVQAQDGRIGAFDAALLFGCLVAYTVFVLLQARRNGAPPDLEADPTGGSALWQRLPVQLLGIAGGLALLVYGADLFVGAAAAIARAAGLSEAVIGLTVVAIGTSAPEAVTSIVAALRGERDMAVGNVVGSNIFNLFGVLGLSGLVASIAGSGGLSLAAGIANFDLWVMLAVAIACLPVFFTGHEIARWEGGLFVGYYAAYAAYLVLDVLGHAALPAYSNVMLGFVIPLTLVTLVVVLLKPTVPPRP